MHLYVSEVVIMMFVGEKRRSGVGIKQNHSALRLSLPSKAGEKVTKTSLAFGWMFSAQW